MYDKDDTLDWEFGVVHNSRPPLRWFANTCGSIAGWAIMRISYQDELEDFGWRYKLHSTIWKITWPIYNKFGTFYKIKDEFYE
jgi:hypothetical protein